VNEREALAWTNLLAAFDREVAMMLDVATMAAKAGDGAPMFALLKRIEELQAFYVECTSNAVELRPVAQA
jgi:hypothetical protein